MWYRSRFCKPGLLRNFPTFLPDKQAKVGSLRRTEEFLPGTSSLPLNEEGGFGRYLRA